MPTTRPHTPPQHRPGSKAAQRAGKQGHHIGEPPPVTRPAPEKFEPKKVLTRTGFRVRDEGRAYGNDLDKVSDALGSLGAGDLFGDVGNVALVLIGGVLALVFLDLLIGDRGSSIVADATKWLGGGIGRLVSPTDPLTTPGTSTTTPAAASSTSGGSSSSSTPSPTPAGSSSSPDAKVKAFFAKTFGAAYPTPAGSYSPITSGSSIEVDSNYVTLVDWIANHFGVTVTSGLRTPAENAAAGGASNSDHLTGLAADFGGTPTALERLYRWATSAGFPYVESPAQAVAAGEGAHVHISFYR